MTGLFTCGGRVRWRRGRFNRARLLALLHLGEIIIKYGVHRSITVEPTDDPERATGSASSPPTKARPSATFATALKEGCDDRGPLDPITFLKRHGIGAGLGAVKRFTDIITLDPAPARRMRSGLSWCGI